MRKLLTGMGSMHSKVATQCISTVKSNGILLKYFITIGSGSGSGSDNDDYMNDSNDNSSSSSSGRPINGSSSRDAELLLQWKKDMLDRLVEVLRRNRNHWHPAVKRLSGELFDTLLNHLE